MQGDFPILTIDCYKMYKNAKSIASKCKGSGIDICGVIKGVNGIIQVAQIFVDAGCNCIASSRLSHIKKCKEAGIQTTYMLLRVSGLSECEDTVNLCDISLQSEKVVLDALENACIFQKKIHNVIIMVDLGDLREGFWDRKEFIETCLYVENSLNYVKLKGIGVNLGCYGSIKPTIEKMDSLVELAETIEEEIGRKLEIISGGATTSFSLVHSSEMPKRINNLRIGECLLLGRVLKEEWNLNDLDYIHDGTFVLSCEVIEVKNKPSYPVGEFCYDAFGNKPEYSDVGIRKRALVALGSADVGDVKKLIPTEQGIKIVGASSDHLILDVTESKRNIKVGDIVEFHLYYSNLLFLTSDENIKIKFKGEKDYAKQN